MNARPAPIEPMTADHFRLHARIEDEHWWFCARRELVARVLAARLPPSRQSTVLEIGMGTGGNLRYLGQSYRCVGVEAAPVALELARQRLDPSTITRLSEDPREYPDLLAECDAVLLLDVLEHIQQDRETLARVVAGLRPGSWILITVPADMRLWRPHDEALGHYRRYEEGSLRQLWESLPVSCALVSYFNTRLYPLVWLACVVSRRSGRTRGLAGTDLALVPGWINRLLFEIFRGEGRVLLDTLEGRRARGYPYGVSLMALLRREPE